MKSERENEKRKEGEREKRKRKGKKKRNGQGNEWQNAERCTSMNRHAQVITSSPPKRKTQSLSLRK